MNVSVLQECTTLSLEGKITFPQVIQKLSQNGTERYCADLVKLEKIYYSPSGDSHVEPMPLKNPVPVGQHFDAAKVKEAVTTIQQGKIDYSEFLRRIMAAGTVFYDVFVNGRRTIYVGRNGDFHVEHFPAAK